MKIINSVFEKSSKTIDQCPNKNLPEFAFVGRSNVGQIITYKFVIKQ
jgi:GTP-binding protein EngB required for normal cell division